MRQIATLDHQAQAKTFSDFLYLQKIENSLRSEEDGSIELWVHDDDQIETAQTYLKKFLENPKSPEFQTVSMQAKFQRAKDKRDQILSRNKTIDVRTQWHLKKMAGGKVTLTLIILSVGLSLVSQLGKDFKILEPFFITGFQEVGPYVAWAPGFHSILSGQVWRLITPIFIHFGILHLLFNMMWLKDLGGIIEGKHSGWYLALQVFVIGALSNVAQYLVSGPSFGGMSGVVYGLLGYVWIRGKFDPGSGLYLHRTIVIWMIGWFVLCLTGLIGNVANTAHAAGLVVGMAWGFLTAQFSRHQKTLR